MTFRQSLLYLVCVLVWGSTWLAIEYQLGDVAIEVSLLYRFALAAMIMLLWCWFGRQPMRFTARQHGLIFLLALMNFSMNYYVVYQAQQYLSSAVTSIAFTSMLLMNIINTRLFFGKKIAKRVYAGALCGVSGIIVLFWPDIKDFTLSSAGALGLVLVLASALIASLGNMVSVYNGSQGIPVLQANAWGMVYGSLILLALIVLRGTPLGFSFTVAYIASLIYLSVFGTVIAFACYFSLLKSVSPERASYVIVLFPIVAVILSMLFEGLQWSTHLAYGIALTLLGNAIVLTPFERFRRT